MASMHKYIRKYTGITQMSPWQSRHRWDNRPEQVTCSILQSSVGRNSEKLVQLWIRSQNHTPHNFSPSTTLNTNRRRQYFVGLVTGNIASQWRRTRTVWKVNYAAAHDQNWFQRSNWMQDMQQDYIISTWWSEYILEPPIMAHKT